MATYAELLACNLTFEEAKEKFLMLEREVGAELSQLKLFCVQNNIQGQVKKELFTFVTTQILGWKQ